MFGRPKKLKKIPSDLLSYIQIEGEAIKDANDKQMIISYAHGKLDTVNWYIDLLTVGSNKYVVPHSMDHLTGLKKQLLAAIKTIMDKQIPSSQGSLSIQYPKGYEG